MIPYLSFTIQNKVPKNNKKNGEKVDLKHKLQETFIFF